jgi:hypothetical protein
MNTKFYYNLNIVNKLFELVIKHPDLRFHQILWSAGIFSADNSGQIEDKFYEESEITWKKMMETAICNKDKS